MRPRTVRGDATERRSGNRRTVRGDDERSDVRGIHGPRAPRVRGGDQRTGVLRAGPAAVPAATKGGWCSRSRAPRSPGGVARGQVRARGCAWRRATPRERRRKKTTILRASDEPAYRRGEDLFQLAAVLGLDDRARLEAMLGRAALGNGDVSAAERAAFAVARARDAPTRGRLSPTSSRARLTESTSQKSSVQFRLTQFRLLKRFSRRTTPPWNRHTTRVMRRTYTTR